MAKAFVQRGKNLTSKLKKLREATQGPVRIALARGGDDLVRMARNLVPDGRGEGEYDLKGTINWYYAGAEGGGSDAKTGRSDSTAIHFVAGDDKNPEARWVEFGTPPHTNEGLFKGTQNPGAPAQPYFYPTYRAHKKPIRRMVSKAVRDAVIKAVK